MSSKLAVISLFIITLTTIGLGCDGDRDDMMSTNGSVSATILRVYPADGATSVSLSASVAVRFSRAMDSGSVMDNFHLLAGDEMHDWMDSVAHHGGLGHMSMRDMSSMMNWMDSIAMPGSFSWSDAMDSCEFRPTSGMLAEQEHMILMYGGGMMDHGGRMMGSDHGDDQYHSYHFMTKE